MGFPDPVPLSTVKVRVDGSRPRYKALSVATAPGRLSLTRPAQRIVAGATRLLIDVSLRTSKALLDANAVDIMPTASNLGPYSATTNSLAAFVRVFQQMAYLLIIFFCVFAIRILLLTRHLRNHFKSKPSGQYSNNSPMRSQPPIMIFWNRLQGSEVSTLARRAPGMTVWKVSIITVFLLLLLLLREAFVDRTSGGS